MSILFIGLVLLAVAIVCSTLLGAAARTDRPRASLRILEVSGLSSLALTGDPFETYTVSGEIHGVDLAIENRLIARRPGPSEDTVKVCVARVPVLLGDMVVCQASEIDAVMGALPAVPRSRTGHRAFDEGYALFVSQASGGYRGAEPAAAGAWAVPEVLDRLVELDLRWIRVREGTAELAFEVQKAGDLGRVAAVAANVARLSRGQPPVATRAGLRATHDPELPHSEPWAAWVVAFVACIPLGIFLAFSETARSVDSETICGTGSQLLEIGCGDGGSCLQCSDLVDRSMFLHYFSCILLIFGGTALAGIVVSVLRRALSRAP